MVTHPRCARLQRSRPGRPGALAIRPTTAGHATRPPWNSPIASSPMVKVPSARRAFSQSGTGAGPKRSVRARKPPSRDQNRRPQAFEFGRVSLRNRDAEFVRPHRSGLPAIVARECDGPDFRVNPAHRDARAARDHGRRLDPHRIRQPIDGDARVLQIVFAGPLPGRARRPLITRPSAPGSLRSLVQQRNRGETEGTQVRHAQAPRGDLQIQTLIRREAAFQLGRFFIADLNRRGVERKRAARDGHRRRLPRAADVHRAA